ncbi:MAG: hypothetical protein PVI09_19010 [Anaerolineae bacterium]|jgi:hypothetical protein
MAGMMQCENCGALVYEEDVFCGECGAPRPDLAADVEPPADADPVAQDLPPEIPERPAPRSSLTGWRVAFVGLLLAAAFLCLSGLASFLLFGMTESDVTTRQEDWLYATFCCLLPLSGAGVVLGLAGLGVWYARLRNR